METSDDWLAVLRDAARASYHHPLRHAAPLEVLSLSLTKTQAPSAVRGAVESLAALHADTSKAAFHEAMDACSHWRDSYLYAKGLSRDAMPVVAVEIASVETLDAAEAFFLAAETTVGGTRIDLSLRVDVRCDGEQTTNTLKLLSRVARILEYLRGQTSRFELKMVELGLGDGCIVGEDVVRMASRVYALSLHGFATAPPSFSVSFKLRRFRGHGDASLAAWGKLFQTMCRVGCDDSDMTVPHENQLTVTIADDCDIVAAFWSAVAYSCGCTRLTILGQHEDNVSRRDPTSTTGTKFMALALLTPANTIMSLHWNKSEFSEQEANVMQAVKDAAASSTEDLSRVLWDPERSASDGARVLETAVLSEGIARKFGSCLHDAGDNEWIDAVVPGFGQCSVKRDQWEGLGVTSSRRERAEPKLERLHLEMAFANRDSYLQVRRLFALIGVNFRVVTIDATSTPCAVETVLAVLESCPVLRELYLNQVQLPQRHIIVDPARVVATRLIKLQLRFVHRARPAPSPGVFTQAFLTDVLPLVGAHLEYLEIRKKAGGIMPFSAAFSTITRCCVSLFHLKLECLDVEDLDSLIDSYRNGTCRISSLYLLQCPVESPSLERFAQFLSDRTCVGSTKLGVLHIGHFSRDPGDAAQLLGLSAPSINAMLVMLELNRTLTELYLGGTDTDAGRIVAEPLRLFKRKFDLYDEQEIPVASEAFPVESTQMLVDALQRRGLPWNQEVVAIIIRFAAQRVRRSVRYEVVNPRFGM